jgi:hypothetical protein
MTKLNKAETKTEFAARVGLTKGRVSQLVAEGLPVREDGMIEVETGLAWMEKNLDPSRRGKGGAINTGFGSPSVADVRRMLMLVQVQRARLAYDKERAKLIDGAEATATIFARARAERDAHMAWVQRAAPLVAAETGADPQVTFAVLDRLMREHLEHLADTPLGNLSDAG